MPVLVESKGGQCGDVPCPDNQQTTPNHHPEGLALIADTLPHKCHRFDFLVTYLNGLNFFELFELLFFTRDWS